MSVLVERESHIVIPLEQTTVDNRLECSQTWTALAAHKEEIQ